MIITNDIKQEFADYARSIKGEACGLIVFNNNQNQLIKCRNVSPNIVNSYEINSEDYLWASTKGRIIASIHSHYRYSKLPKFSILDKIISEEHELVSILYDVNSKTFFEYKPCGYSNNYIGRIFSWGSSDCFSLISDYYKQELNIIVSISINRDKNIFHINDFNKANIFNIAKKNNFDIYDYNIDFTLCEHDILFTKKNITDVNPSHLSIYIGDEKILHQPRQQPSTIEYINKYKQLITYVFRHQTL